MLFVFIGKISEIKGSGFVDPSFIGGEVPKLAPIDEINEENECEFTEYVGYEEGEDFEDALETLRSGHYDAAAHLLRAFI